MLGFSSRKLGLSLLLLVVIVAVLWARPRFAIPVEGAVQPRGQSGSADCPEYAEDLDGNRYAVVSIGKQCWFQQNLAVQRYRDGTPIEDTTVIDKARYGLLYRFEHVNHEAGLCPLGWHVPSDREFMELEAFIGMSDTAIQADGWRGDNNESRQLKKYDTAFSWTEDEKRQVNRFGFSFQPAGASLGGRTTGPGRFGDLWSSTEFDAETAWYRSVFWISVTSPFRGDVEKIRRRAVSKNWAFSVRCLRDDTAH